MNDTESAWDISTKLLLEKSGRILFSQNDPIWKRPPFKHQEEMARFHYERPFSLDLSEVGTGKTGGLCTWLQKAFNEKKVTKTLVVCPNSVTGAWESELKAWTNLRFITLRGPKEKRIALLIQPNIADVFIINYESTRIIAQHLAAARFNALILDEIHRCKSYNSLQSKALLALSKSIPYRKGASGTILTNSLLDIWPIAQIINPTIYATNYWGFRSRYMFDENAGKSWLSWPSWQPKPGAVKEVQRCLEPHAIRFSKRDVLAHLPPVLFQRREVDLSGEQERVYKQLKKDFVAELDRSDEELAALQILDRVNKLLQVTSGFAYRNESETYQFNDNAKLAELKNILDDLEGKQTIIWCAYRHDVEIVKSVIRGSYGVITGETKAENRQEVIDSFNNGDIQVVICNASCAGEGISLFAEYSVYYSRSWRLGDRIQSLGRFDRPGSERYSNLTVIDIVARSTLDEEVMASLTAKEDLLKAINPKRWKEMLTQ